MMVRSVLQKIALMVASLVLALAALEIGLRAIHLLRPPPPRAQPSPDPELAKLPQLKGVLALARPNTRGVFKGVLHRTNSAGFRGPEYAIPKPPGVFRTVIIGDSFTMGSGVTEEDTYAVRLEHLLNQADAQRTHEVLNLGIGGLNLRTSLRRLKSIGLRHDPDLIVYGWTHNDIEGPAYRKRTKPVRGLGSPSQLVRWAAPRWRELRDIVYPEPTSYLYELDENYFRNPEAWADFLADLDQLASVVQKQGVCGVVFLHTSLRGLHRFHAFQRHYDAVREAAAERGLAIVASFPSFRGQEPRSLWINSFDSHPNAEGHRILSEALNAGLRQLPAQCGLSDGAMAVGKVEWLDPTKTHDGFTLIAPLAGNDVYWVTMTGAVAKRVHTDHTVTHAEQLPSGTLLTLSRGLSSWLRELDGDGRTIWSYSSPSPRIHHDAILSPRDTFFVLVNEVNGETWHEQIIEIERDGEIVWTWDSLDHLDPSDQTPFATRHVVNGAIDWFHPNSLDLFPDGDVLVSMRNLNQLLRIDYPSGEIVWSWGPGVLGHQHAAKLLENGRILLFDNGIYREQGRLCDPPCWSRALEIDPETGQIVWSFEDRELFSTGFGDADRLPNGNTLITFGWASPRAIILEVTPAGEVVWKFESLVETRPNLFGKKPTAMLYRSQRVERIP